MQLIRIHNFGLDFTFSPQLFIVGFIYWEDEVPQGTFHNLSLVILGLTLIFMLGVPHEG